MNPCFGVDEFGLIDIIKKKTASFNNEIYGIGDDCAIIPIDDKKEILVTTDTLIEGVHFFKNSNPYYLGRKSLSVNISDVAAMAAKPKWAFLALTVSDSIDLAYIKEFMDGFKSVMDDFGVLLLGGDTTKGNIFSITITVIGENKRYRSVKRNSAKVNNDIYVTGNIGCSYAGFIAIKDDIKINEQLKMAHINPTARIKEAMLVQAYAASMIDISDGFIQDCLHICNQSGVGFRIDFDKIPFCPDVNFVDRVEMLSGGEDYELIFTADKKYRSILNKIENITMVGSVIEGNGVEILKDNKRIDIANTGYKHF